MDYILLYKAEISNEIFHNWRKLGRHILTKWTELKHFFLKTEGSIKQILSRNKKMFFEMDKVQGDILPLDLPGHVVIVGTKASSSKMKDFVSVRSIVKSRSIVLLILRCRLFILRVELW